MSKRIQIYLDEDEGKRFDEAIEALASEDHIRMTESAAGRMLLMKGLEALESGD